MVICGLGPIVVISDKFEFLLLFSNFNNMAVKLAADGGSDKGCKVNRCTVL